MPNSKLNNAVKQAYAGADRTAQFLRTLEITHGTVGGETKRADICFVVDDTGSMGGAITNVKAIISDVAAELANIFEVVRYGLVRFKDEGDTTVAQQLTNDAPTIQAAVDALTATGGGDTAENGFGATVLACNSMTWTSGAYGVRRFIVLVTDAASHERGNTEAEALAALANKNVTFVLGSTSFSNHNYDNLIDNTDGGLITNFDGDAETVKDALVTMIQNITNVGGVVEPYYIVQSTQSHDLVLETGETKTFEPVAFRMDLPGQNDQGIQTLNIAIDNVDQRIGKFIEDVLPYEAPVIVKHRVWLASDPSTPVFSPPLQLTLSDVQTTQKEVTGRASFADIVNLKFLREKYTRRRFPSLGNT